ncbi:Transposon TX1 uncharacterized protein [Glycine soja]
MVKSAGSSFTWIRPNDSVKSRLDRFLVSDKWLSTWPDSCQHVLPHNFSDHCLTILQTKLVDWGPKPFRVADWWIHQKGYQNLCSTGGWGGFVLKNKLMYLKDVIRQWSKDYGFINDKGIQKIQQKLNEVENLASNTSLSEEDIKAKRDLQQQLWEVSNAYESLLRQKSRAKWLKEGDCNSAYYQSGWLSKWPDSSQFNLERNYSDHCPIIMHSKCIDWGPKPFKVYDGWLMHKQFQKVVRDCWLDYQPMGKDNIGDLCSKVKQLQQKLNDLENSMPVQPSEQQVKDLKKTQADLWEKATMQESIVRWIKEGDSNTSYFHRVINLRRRRNALRGLQIGDTWVENPNIIKAETLHHFQNRFNEPHLSRPNLDGISFKSLPSTHREIMIEPFKEEEIRCVVWACGNDKGPGPHGFNFRFIKHFWKELKPEFLRFIAEFHVNASFPKGLNSSFIALIPKIKDPQSFNDFRPISLIGCVYKIIAKLLANRLSKVMNHLIDERQTAFVKGRQLLHGVLIANEVVEEARRSKRPCRFFSVCGFNPKENLGE